MKRKLKVINNNISKVSHSVCLIAVIKKQQLKNIKEVLGLGVYHLGINYLQEYQEFEQQLCHEKIKWHYIGNIQSKKINKIVGHFCLIHSVSNMQSLSKINSTAEDKGLIQDILLQINLANEPSKSGFSLELLRDNFEAIGNYKSVNVKGFMTMPPIGQGEVYFKQLSELKKEYLNKTSHLANFNIDYLSMGTSGDYTQALQYGATHIRLGTVLLGERK